MNAYRFKIRSIPYLFILITSIAYGLFFWQTGFYWDDWPFAWIAKYLGPQEFFRAFEGVRPFLSPIFFATTSLIPPIPIYWQLFALVIQCGIGLSAWFALSQIWPQHKQQMLVASLLLLVFPGHSQHWVAFTHINQERIPFIFYLLSFGFTARALRNSEAFIRDTALALIFAVAGVFPTEYFVGLEPLRFLFIWIIVSERESLFKQRTMQAYKRWQPYMVVWLGNAAWLAYFYTIGSYDSYTVTVAWEPFSILRVFSIALDAFWKVGFYIWGQILALIYQTLTAPATFLTIGLILLSFFILLFYLTRLDLPANHTQAFAVSAMLMGLAGILLGRVPSFAAGLPLTLQSSFDRFMISMMLGGCLFIMGLIELVIKNQHAKIVVSALLIALGIGQQFFNANIFRRDWETQQEILWQLLWRAPGLQPDTVLITDELPLDYETDLSFTAPINWMYGSNHADSRLAYGMIFSKIRLGGSLQALQPNIPIYIGMRGANFYSSTSQTVVIYMPKDGCLRIMDPSLGDQITYNDLSKYLVGAIPLSDPSRIMVNANSEMGIPFLSEPEHQWCYYYTKAELARQNHEWQEIIRLMEEAKAMGYQPSDPFEWLPYIEAQARTGNVIAAEKMSAELMISDKKIGKGVCQVWERIQAQVPAGSEKESQINNILFQFACEK